MSEAAFHRAHDDLGRFRAALESEILGQSQVVDEVLTGFCAGGHLLLEGLPGLGKTALVKRLAASLNLPLSRIQCTPDLLPADVIGSEMQDEHQRLTFRPGPLFAPLVLVDEINRATPRTQAAFLEAMQEDQVTYLGHHYPLPRPFRVLATQNPIELEGTFPLPEAQLDRFMMKIVVPAPSADTLLAIAGRTLEPDAAPLPPVLDGPGLENALAQVQTVIVAEPLRRAAVDLVVALQPEAPAAHPLARRHLRYGPSPRALQALLRCARASALLRGRGHVAIADLRHAAPGVLRHRLLLRFESTLDGLEADALLASVVSERLT